MRWLRYWTCRRPCRSRRMRWLGSVTAVLAWVVRRRIDQMPSRGLRSGALDGRWGFLSGACVLDRSMISRPREACLLRVDQLVPVLPRPLAGCVQRAQRAPAERGQGILDTALRALVLLPCDETVPFQLAQGLGQRLGGDATQRDLELRESARAVLQAAQDQRGPLVAHAEWHQRGRTDGVEHLGIQRGPFGLWLRHDSHRRAVSDRKPALGLRSYPWKRRAAGSSCSGQAAGLAGQPWRRPGGGATRSRRQGGPTGR
ncbi:hypothetical protein SLAV_37755 [Streptomyces lavendulae subsp. lavendulae]|uniref:Uncharacterized protein n=1 Tax=Streptomyces lavendulae subsp. lavendulae TaxID=58340 RepID=A0A2K8PUI4_STRLA|nr:hypothetical protein SLAV_37755 [Streptomyces lavendulae subsp. lavendulae]